MFAASTGYLAERACGWAQPVAPDRVRPTLLEMNIVEAFKALLISTITVHSETTPKVDGFC